VCRPTCAGAKWRKRSYNVVGGHTPSLGAKKGLAGFPKSLAPSKNDASPASPVVELKSTSKNGQAEMNFFEQDSCVAVTHFAEARYD